LGVGHVLGHLLVKGHTTINFEKRISLQISQIKHFAELHKRVLIKPITIQYISDKTISLWQT